MHSDTSKVELLDDRQEWLRFSQPHKPTLHGSDDCWDSHVVIQGMHCAACAFTVEEALMSVPGVQSAEVNAATHRAKVVWSAAQVKPSAWMAAIAKVGYGALPAADSSLRQARHEESRRALWRWLVAGFCMMQVMMYAYPAYVSREGDITPDMVFLLRWASWVLTLPVVLFACGPFFGNALRDIRARRVSMDLPVALGMVITFLLSSVATFEPEGVFGAEVYYDSLTMFVFFLLTGRWLELRVRDRTAGALEALMNRLPDSVERQLPSGEFERVAVRRVMVGDVIRVLPSESFPADGVILQGQTLADEALLTGESRPQARGVGDTVVAGSHNLSGIVTVRVVQVGEGTQFSQIVSLMENASLQKPRLAQLADRIAKPFLIGVLVLAALSAVYWWPTNPGHALMVAVAVLVVTCPCALSLATPAAMLAAAGNLARHGVLVRNLQALESLAEIDTVIFDKTGTLTQDGQRVTQVMTAEGVTPEYALDLAAALAKHSLHPLSRALVQAHDEASGRSVLDVQDVNEMIGQGLEGQLDGCLRLGSAAFCAPKTKGIPDKAEVCQVHLCRENAWLASWQLSEDVRADAVQTVQALKHLNLDVWLLSGDRPESAQQVAQQVGITRAFGACTPQDKLSRMQAAQSQGARVAMVGDGLNDGPVLAGAHVSMAFGNAVPLAQSKSDLVLMGGSLLVVAQSIKLARHTLRVVKQNLVWAAAYNALCVPLAVVGWLPAWLAGLGMALSSLWVVLNSLRLTKGF
ncbi:cation-translocating P-type ATPase [Limnohabitans sp. TEGF004]|jgi:Cu2+-exporting ATPase|uniref:heavy metal translocating P-type ATPase n=1 Tax=Limnohabitans sp. TEGF004 TaxID=2986281 RepID=UPI002377B77B|nr:cation-translocating P-type ATPase [Limnohabitans sp. TEGF004]BDU55074.1 cation-transporting P-type ATPase [Limnohabitans sp. TEGF004]